MSITLHLLETTNDASLQPAPEPRRPRGFGKHQMSWDQLREMQMSQASWRAVTASRSPSVIAVR
jgi:hypothetical protein